MRLLLIGTGATAAGYYRALQHFLLRNAKNRTREGGALAHQVGAGAPSREMPKEEVPSIDLEIWDKARGYGGRMSTSRSTEVEGSKSDLGVQYFTLYEESHDELYEALEQAQVLQRFTGTFEGQKEAQKRKQNYVAPQGSSTVIKHLFEGSSPCFGRTVSQIDYLDGTPPQWQVYTQDGVCDYFDGIICTLPAPQVLQLKGDLRSLLSSSRLSEPLEQGAYTSRYALGLYFNSSQATQIENLFPECGKYVSQEEDDVIRFVSYDSKKRGSNSSESPSLVVHTSVSYGNARLEDSKDTVQNEVLEHLHKLFPSLPTPVGIKTQRWRYSQVSQPVGGEHGGAVLLSRAASGDNPSMYSFSHSSSSSENTEQPFIVFCGDSFMPSSNFDSCLTSAHRAFELTPLFD